MLSSLSMTYVVNICKHFILRSASQVLLKGIYYTKLEYFFCLSNQIRNLCQFNFNCFNNVKKPLLE